MYEIERLIGGGRAIVNGELKDLVIDKEVECTYAGDVFIGVVETRFSGGAVVRLEEQRLRRQ